MYLKLLIFISLFWTSSNAALAEDSSVYCGEENQRCPEAVGVISIPSLQDGGYMGTCTGFLIDETTFVTNAHCLIDSKPSIKALNSCNDIVVRFPTVLRDDLTTIEAETVGCEKIIALSNPTDFKPAPDYAFVQLSSKPKRKPLEITQEGAPSDGIGILYKADMRSDRMNIDIHQETCAVTYDTVIEPNGTSTDSPAVNLTECEARHGNSGSPVLNSDGKVWAILHGFFVTDNDSDAKPNSPAQSFDKELALSYSRWNRLAFASNFSCIPIPGQYNDLPKSCFKKQHFANRHMLVEDYISNNPETIQSRIDESFKQISTDTPALEGFGWTATTMPEKEIHKIKAAIKNQKSPYSIDLLNQLNSLSERKSFLVYLPACIESPEQASASLTKTKNLTFKMPTAILDIALNPNFQLELLVSDAEFTPTVKIEFSSKKKKIYALVKASSSSQDLIINEFEVKPCANREPSTDVETNANRSN